jgi:hypothetical protein
VCTKKQKVIQNMSQKLRRIFTLFRHWFSEKGAREKVDQLNKTLSETELSRQNAVTHWQQEAENIRQTYRVSLFFVRWIKLYVILHCMDCELFYTAYHGYLDNLNVVIVLQFLARANFARAPRCLYKRHTQQKVVKSDSKINTCYNNKLINF